MLPNKVYNPDNPQGLTLLTKLWLGPSHLREYEFKRNFLDTINLPFKLLKYIFFPTVQAFVRKNYPYE